MQTANNMLVMTQVALSRQPKEMYQDDNGVQKNPGRQIIPAINGKVDYDEGDGTEDSGHMYDTETAAEPLPSWGKYGAGYVELDFTSPGTSSATIACVFR
jgi:hypothetical protein